MMPTSCLHYGIRKTSQAIGYKRIITCVERIADHISTIAKVVVDMDKNISKTPKDIINTYQNNRIPDKTMTLFQRETITGRKTC